LEVRKKKLGEEKGQGELQRRGGGGSTIKTIYRKEGSNPNRNKADPVVRLTDCRKNRGRKEERFADTSVSRNARLCPREPSEIRTEVTPGPGGRNMSGGRRMKLSKQKNLLK